MSGKSQRVKEKTKLDLVSKYIHKYAYTETLTLVVFFLAIGYIINPKDICLLEHNIPYMMIILSVITLFHGFENGVFAVTLFSFAMWIFYPIFNYIEFLLILLMTLIFSQFHYYWSSRIKQAEVDANYKAEKLSELSRAFFSLKISHDQLEKNYVVKPMSIRNSIKHILSLNEEIFLDASITDKAKHYQQNFLELLEKSFNIQAAHILYLDNPQNSIDFTALNTKMVTVGANKNLQREEILSNHLVDKSIGRKSPIYISDEAGEPSAINEFDTKYLAAIPALVNNTIVSLLVIEKMPFMFFNREYLTSITILHEYFALENRKHEVKHHIEGFELIKDADFKFEISRLIGFEKTFKVNSILLVLRTQSELQTQRLNDKLEKILRSLDMATLVEYNEYYFLTILLPLHDKSAATGLLNRLKNMLDDEKDKKFDSMIFDMEQLELLLKYYRSDYGDS